MSYSNPVAPYIPHAVIQARLQQRIAANLAILKNAPLPMPPYRTSLAKYTLWSTDEVEVFKDMAFEGYSREEISSSLKRTKRSVRNQARLLMIEHIFKPNHLWQGSDYLELRSVAWGLNDIKTVGLKIGKTRRECLAQLKRFDSMI